MLTDRYWGLRHDDDGAKKDLGVLFDRKLSFTQHIGSIVKIEGESDMIGLTIKAHFPLHGRRSISADVHLIDETARTASGVRI